MTSPKSDSADSLVSVARAVRTRGLKGEIVAELLTDFPERFEGLTSLIALAPDGDRTSSRARGLLVSERPRSSLKLSGYDDVETAEAFRRIRVLCSRDERVALEQESITTLNLKDASVSCQRQQRLVKFSRF